MAENARRTFDDGSTRKPYYGDKKIKTNTFPKLQRKFKQTMSSLEKQRRAK